MFENISEEDKLELGKLAGKPIADLFEMIAAVDGITFKEAVDRWIEVWIVERIIEATGENDAA